MSKKRNRNKIKPSVTSTPGETSGSALDIRRPGQSNEIFYIIVLLTTVTLIAYSGVATSDFAYYDDEHYITANDHIHQGVTWEGIKWAFTSVGYSDNWHPLTWLSHMLDVQFFGLNPGGHHVMNLLFHIIATLLLFGFLRYATGETRLSVIVAALFAWHPLHVESVAWIAERKDVLSAVFWSATLWVYAYYTRSPSFKKYSAVVILFALGLLTKPMLVTLPFVMLLLDFWPLKRQAPFKRSVGWLITEKFPLLAMVIASAVITIIAQQGAVRSLTSYDLSTRIANAIISYCVYIGQAFWPTNLAVLYPYTRPQISYTALSVLALAAVTAAALWQSRNRKYVITGWLWYLGTLVPVIGIMQVGSQVHADRYTYIPYTGLFIMIVWGLNELTQKISAGKKVLLKFALIIIFSLMVFRTRDQVKYWKDGITLLTHTLSITRGNEIAHYNLGNLMQQAGRIDEAIAHYNAALKINPKKIDALGNLAGVYFQTKQYEKAKSLIQRALDLAKAAGDEQQVRDIRDNMELLDREYRLFQKQNKNKIESSNKP